MQYIYYLDSHKIELFHKIWYNIVEDSLLQRTFQLEGSVCTPSNWAILTKLKRKECKKWNLPKISSPMNTHLFSTKRSVWSWIALRKCNQTITTPEDAMSNAKALYWMISIMNLSILATRLIQLVGCIPSAATSVIAGGASFRLFSANNKRKGFSGNSDPFPLLFYKVFLIVKLLILLIYKTFSTFFFLISTLFLFFVVSL